MQLVAETVDANQSETHHFNTASIGSRQRSHEKWYSVEVFRKQIVSIFFVEKCSVFPILGDYFYHSIKLI